MVTRQTFGIETMETNSEKGKCEESSHSESAHLEGNSDHEATQQQVKLDQRTDAAPAKSATHNSTRTFAGVPSTPRLYVGNLHPRVTETHLESLLTARSLAVQQIQFILSSNNHVATSSSQQSPQKNQFAFVTLPSKADAARAIQLLHGRKLMGRFLVVQPAHEQQTQQQQYYAPHNRRGAKPVGNYLGTGTTSNSISKNREKRQLDDQIEAIRSKLKKSQG